jgi:hypothetical protein
MKAKLEESKLTVELIREVNSGHVERADGDVLYRNVECSDPE